MPEQFTINVSVDIQRRKAVCDICCQGNQMCLNATNSSSHSDSGSDICEPCIRKLALLLGMSLPIEGGESPAPDRVKHMVDRFLQWKLPADFNPDGGIEFKKTGEPVGTNLLTATQAEAMVRFMIDGI